MKILLINLPTDGIVRDYSTPDYFLTDFMQYPPLGLLAIAAGVGKEHSVKVLDCALQKMTIDSATEYILDHKPDVLGISVVTRYLYPMSMIARKVKENAPAIRIVAGGPHVNYFPKETMELGAADYCLPGFGELTFPLLVEAISGGAAPDALSKIPGLFYKNPDGRIISNPAPEQSAPLDGLPFPDRSLIDPKDYYTAADFSTMTTMYSSRGCPFHCIFCDVQEKRYHFRSPKRIADEMESIEKLGIREIHIFDDTFNVDRARVLEICREVIRRGLKIKWSSRVRAHPFDDEMASLMKQAGCERLHIGVESLDPEILKSIKKGITPEQIRNFFALCNRHGLKTLAYFIVGFPNETKEYREKLFENVKKLKPTYVYFNTLYPLPRTEYYRSLLKDGVFERDYWEEFIREPKADFELPLPREQELQSELLRMADRYHRKFFFSPVFVLKEFINSLSNPKMLFLKFKIAFSLFFKTGLFSVLMIPLK